MSKINLERFLEMASQDEQTKSQLKAAPTQSKFVELVVGLGKEKGYEFTAADVNGALANMGTSTSAELSEAELEAVAGGDNSQSNAAQMLANMSYIPGAC